LFFYAVLFKHCKQRREHGWIKGGRGGEAAEVDDGGGHCHGDGDDASVAAVTGDGDSNGVLGNGGKGGGGGGIANKADVRGQQIAFLHNRMSSGRPPQLLWWLWRRP
jgi:hypothetical protein